MTAAASILPAVAPSFRPPKLLTVSEWADEFRILDERASSNPGRWRTSYVPYAREIMDAISDPTIEEVVFQAASQIAKTESILNGIAHAIDNDPGPTLVVMPREEDAESFSQNRLHPMIRSTPALAAHVMRKGDLGINECYFDRMTLWLVGSNSPAALASKPVRYVFLDEIDKYPSFSGREADPVKLAQERTKTYWNRKFVKASTPTTETGYIHNAFLRSDQRYYFVPCTHCGAFQRLKFGQIKWPKEERDHVVVRNQRLAWYECEHCQKKLTDLDKKKMLALGEWRAQRPVDGWRKIAGFQISSIYSPWLTFSDVAAEFLSSNHDNALLMNFVNSWLGEIWKEVKSSLKAEGLLARSIGTPENVCPANTSLLLGSIDVQRGHVWASVRAYLPDRRSVLITSRHIEDIDKNTAKALRTAWNEVIAVPYAVQGKPDPTNVIQCAVDSGDGMQTDIVYSFCMEHAGVAVPIKGNTQMNSRWGSSIIDRFAKTGRPIPGGLQMILVNTELWRMHVHGAFGLPIDEAGAYLVHENAPSDYAAHVTAWAQKKEKDKKGREFLEWHQLSTDDHLLDNDCYMACLAEIIGVRYLAGQQKDQGPSVSVVKPAVPDWARRERY